MAFKTLHTKDEMSSGSDNVSIFNDFNFEVEDGDLDVSDEELNLVYVAVTRAKKNLDVTGIKKLLVALENDNNLYSNLVDNQTKQCLNAFTNKYQEI